MVKYDLDPSTPPTREGQLMQIEEYREKWCKLIDGLEKIGTNVFEWIYLEEDDIPPFVLVYKSEICFIFPAQSNAELELRKAVKFEREEKIHKQAKFQESLVTGHISVKYDDGGLAPNLYIADKMPNGSELPPEVLALLNETFACTEQDVAAASLKE